MSQEGLYDGFTYNSEAISSVSSLEKVDGIAE